MIQITAQSKELLKQPVMSTVKVGITVGFMAVTLLAASPFALSLSPSSQAHAQSVRTMTIVPPTVQLELNPGETTEGTMKIINDSDEPLDLSVMMQDFIVDNKNSIPNILTPDTLSNKYSASAWIGIDQMLFSVQPTKTQQLHYYVQVPKNARPGGHYAASIFSPKTESQANGSGAVVNSQIGTLFYITVKGPVTQKATVESFTAPGFSEYGPVAITTNIKNSSDIHVQPNGMITVKNMFGQTREKLSFSGKNIFPEAVREFVHEAGKKSFMIGRYTATLNAYYGSNHDLPLVATVAFWVIPWKIIVVITLAIIAAVLGYLAMKKRNTTPEEPKEQQPTETTDHEEGMKSQTEAAPKHE